MANYEAGLWKYGALMTGLYGASHDWYLKLNAGINGLTDGTLEKIIRSASNPIPTLTELAPYGLLMLLAVEIGAKKLKNKPQVQIPHR